MCTLHQRYCGRSFDDHKVASLLHVPVAPMGPCTTEPHSSSSQFVVLSLLRCSETRSSLMVIVCKDTKDIFSLVFYLWIKGPPFVLLSSYPWSRLWKELKAEGVSSGKFELSRC